MPMLVPMPAIIVPPAELQRFGARWVANAGALKRSPPESSLDFGQLFTDAVARSLATMLGSISVERAVSTSLLPARPNCVETGEVRTIGGVRPQNFDVGYRPDGVRFAHDTKTLNDKKSVGKNYQNMVNDLASEATTVHVRFPSALVTFVVAIPGPCLGNHYPAIVSRLEGLARRNSDVDPNHLAEAISLVVWDPPSGTVEAARPDPNSPLRIEKLSDRVFEAYRLRYGGLPPHV